VHAAVTVPALAAAHLRRKHRFVLVSNQEPCMKINQLVAALALGLAFATTGARLLSAANNGLHSSCSNVGCRR
jgi:hypothetical protein